MFKDTEYTRGDDIVVIPLTSALRQKKSDEFDVFLAKDADNKLFQNSFARLRQIRSVSIKRLGKPVGTLTNQEVQKTITNAVKTMLAIEE